MSTHPRTLGRAWLRSPTSAPREAREPAARPPPNGSRLRRLVPGSMPLPFEAEPVIALVPTTDETLRALGVAIHRLSREETAAWNASDEAERAEARRAIREAVRDRGGGELRDHEDRLLERIEHSSRR